MKEKNYKLPFGGWRYNYRLISLYLIEVNVVVVVFYFFIFEQNLMAHLSSPDNMLVCFSCHSGLEPL